MQVESKNKLRWVFSHLRSRAKFMIWYPWALKSRAVVRRLHHSTQHAFDHPWVSGVETFLVPRHGYDQRTYVAVDAPIVAVVLRRSQPALIMSCSIVGKTLTIRQLQGVGGTNVPRDLEWPA